MHRQPTFAASEYDVTGPRPPVSNCGIRQFATERPQCGMLRDPLVSWAGIVVNIRMTKQEEVTYAESIFQ